MNISRNILATYENVAAVQCRFLGMVELYRPGMDLVAVVMLRYGDRLERVLEDNTPAVPYAGH